MSATIKVVFEDKLYRMSPASQTIEAIDKEMKLRFPEATQLKYFYQNKPVKQMSVIVADALKQGKNTVKIEAKVENSPIEDIHEVEEVKT